MKQKILYKNILQLMCHSLSLKTKEEIAALSSKNESFPTKTVTGFKHYEPEWFPRDVQAHHYSALALFQFIKLGIQLSNMMDTLAACS